MPFWQFFRNRLIGWIGHALLVQPSKNYHSNRKILFVLGLYEYLERLEGKIRDGILFCVNKSGNYSVLSSKYFTGYISENCTDKILSLAIGIRNKNYGELNQTCYLWPHVNCQTMTKNDWSCSFTEIVHDVMHSVKCFSEKKKCLSLSK